MAWIKSHQEIGRHPKTRYLARLLGTSVPAVVGHLHIFWHWCLDYAQSGDLSRYEEDELADAAMWDGDAHVFVDGMINSGFIDDQDNVLQVHDWLEYSGSLMRVRAQNAERQRKCREKNQAKKT